MRSGSAKAMELTANTFLKLHEGAAGSRSGHRQNCVRATRLCVGDEKASGDETGQFTAADA
jgi:hypothetical protein